MRTDAAQPHGERELSTLLAGAQTCPRVSLLLAEAGVWERRGRLEHQGTDQIMVCFMAVLRDPSARLRAGLSCCLSPVHSVLRQCWNGAFICPFVTKETQLWLYISFLGEISLFESFQSKGTYF